MTIPDRIYWLVQLLSYREKAHRSPIIGVPRPTATSGHSYYNSSALKTGCLRTEADGVVRTRFGVRAESEWPKDRNWRHPMSLLILVCVFFICLGVIAAPPARSNEGHRLNISWNLLPRAKTGGHYPSELVIENAGDQSLGNHGWQLYFNFCRKILPQEPNESFSITHVNGDLFRLEPRDNFTAFRQGTKRTFQFQTESALIKQTDAPNGFFVVLNDAVRHNKVVEALGDPVVGPINSKTQTLRAPDDEVAAPTAGSRYEENLELMPVEVADWQIVPTPVAINATSGKFEINNKTTIVADKEFQQEASYLADALQTVLKSKIAIHAEPTNSTSIRLAIKDLEINGQSKKAGDNAYQLVIGPEQGIEITGTDRAGIFYGIQSLRALLPVSSYRQSNETIKVPSVTIEDYPALAYRGLHLDVARNFQSPEAVKKLLELMAFYKLNKFHFHLTDDEGWRLEIKGLPELTEIGGKRGFKGDDDAALLPSFGSGSEPDAKSSHGTGHYSREEFLDILRFAYARHIEVIPEFDLPGHSRAAIYSMKARQQRLLAEGKAVEANEFVLHDPDDTSQYESVQMWNDNVVNVCQESTYKFVEHVLNDIRSMYDEAGVDLKTVHLGGDEVPTGVWKDSKQCQDLYSQTDREAVTLTKDAMAQFFQRISDSLSADDIVMGAWEEVFLNDMRKSQVVQDASRNRFVGPEYQCYVWNNVWGWGQEDVAYRLANAGVNVVLCNATHLYFDLAYNKDPREPGYYWAGFTDTKTVYSFAPMNYLAKMRRDIFGHDIALENIQRREKLTEEGRKHILGIQGQLWAENLKGQQQLEYMALPKLIALAERAWAQEPVWITDDNPETWPMKFREAWSSFAAQLGQRELPRLDYLLSGFEYRIPEAGAVIEDGMLKANVSLPGLTIHYTTDGSVPNQASPTYTEPVPAPSQASLKVFTTNGRSSRATKVQEQIYRAN